MFPDQILLSPPDVGIVERSFLLNAFDSNWLAPAGPEIERFEQEIARRTGVLGGVAVSSGTAALHLALRILGVGPGDSVLVPTLTFAATANVVRYVGATPVFVDCSRSTWTVDPGLVADAVHDAGTIPGRIAAMISVDLYGQCADYDALSAACADADVEVIEDAAEALGATYRGRPAGSLARVGAFSFNGNKIITTSGGGMLVTDDVALAAEARYLSTQARDPAPHYEHRTIGYNYRLSNLLAAIGRAQLRTLDAKVCARRGVNRRYREALSNVPGVEFMPIADYGEPTCWLTCMVIDPDEFGAGRDDVIRHLRANRIESRPTWKPMHLQPVFADSPVVGGEVSEAIFRGGLCLPSGSNLREHDVDRVIEVFLSTPRAGRARREAG